MNPLEAATIRRWSTDDVPPAQRLDYWIGAICEGFLEMDATSPLATRFHSSLESAPLGCIGVNRVCGSAQDVYRSAGAIAKSRENYFYLLCKTDTAWSTTQGGRSARLLPGDAVLVDRLSVAEIGRRVGLRDASHFIRLCRRHLGATPGLLRRSR